jgi:hypothetical protein
MKRFYTVFLAMAILLTPIFVAATTPQPSPQNPITITNLNTNKNENQNANVNLNTNRQEQGQAQGQLQGQAQSMINGQNISPAQTVSINAPRPVIDTLQITPIDIPVYQNGKFGDYTSQMPNFKGLRRLATTEVVVKVLDVYEGWKLSRIRLGDLEKKILDTKIAGDKVRYSVKYLDAVSSGGIGGGVDAARASTDGLTSTAASILPGYHTSGSNPRFIITYYEIE